MAKKMKNDNPRGTSDLRDLYSTFTRAARLLEYLKRNTDKNHKITQAALLRAGDDNDRHIFGVKKTLVKTVAALAYAMNTDQYGMKPEADWRLSYKQFDEYHGGDSDGEMPKGVTEIYYDHVFTEDELTAIINALHTSKAVHKAQADTIVDKLVENFASKYYKKPAYRLDFSEPSDGLPHEDRARLSRNITVIQKAIGEGSRVSFDYNRAYSDPRGYDKKYKDSRGKLHLYGERFHYVSPYYITCENGRLILYGRFKNGKICALRVDMIKKICLAGKGKSTQPSLDRREIGLSAEMTQEFKARHLYSSYEKNWITATFEWSCRDDKTGEFICTALNSTFGDAFKMDENGIVTVNASRFGMKIFALQYADYVKVISPDDLVDDIADSVRELREKYL